MNCGSGAFHGSCRWLLILPSFPGFSPSSRAICTCACERRAACAPQPRPGPEAEEPSVTFPYEPAQPMTIGLDPFRALSRHRQQGIHSAAHLTYPRAQTATILPLSIATIRATGIVCSVCAKRGALADLGPPARLSRSTRHGPAVKFAVQEDSLRSRPNPGQRGGDRTDISSDDFLGKRG